MNLNRQNVACLIACILVNLMSLHLTLSCTAYGNDDA